MAFFGIYNFLDYLFEPKKLEVNFIQINQPFYISVDDLILKFGNDIPKYNIIEGTDYYYLLCIPAEIDIIDLAEIYKFKISIMHTSFVDKNKFNSKYIAGISYKNDEDYYQLYDIETHYI
jgi:hypothetical protein